MNTQKGNVGGLSMVIIGAAITIFIGIWVISTITGSVTLTSTYGYVASSPNTSAITTSTSYNLPEVALYTHSFVLSNSTIVITNTTGTAVTTTNYTAYDNGTIVMGTWASGATGGGLNFTYEYSYVPDSAYDSFDNATNTTWNAINLLSVALIIMAAMAILGYFGMSGKIK